MGVPPFTETSICSFQPQLRPSIAAWDRQERQALTELGQQLRRQRQLVRAAAQSCREEGHDSGIVLNMFFFALKHNFWDSQLLSMINIISISINLWFMSYLLVPFFWQKHSWFEKGLSYVNSWGFGFSSWSNQRRWQPACAFAPRLGSFAHPQGVPFWWAKIQPLEVLRMMEKTGKFIN